jgi:hypothetical protein
MPLYVVSNVTNDSQDESELLYTNNQVIEEGDASENSTENTSEEAANEHQNDRENANLGAGAEADPVGQTGLVPKEDHATSEEDSPAHTPATLSRTPPGRRSHSASPAARPSSRSISTTPSTPTTSSDSSMSFRHAAADSPSVEPEGHITPSIHVPSPPPVLQPQTQPRKALKQPKRYTDCTIRYGMFMQQVNPTLLLKHLKSLACIKL